MNVVFISQECFPFASVSGLANLTCMLAKDIEGLGHNVTIFIPRYNSIDPSFFHIERLPIEFKISFNETKTNIILYKGVILDSLVSVFLIESQNHFSNSKEIYLADDKDNEERNRFFSLASLDVISKLKLDPNVIHIFNAGTAHIAKLLRSKNVEYAHLNKTSLIFTIHNLIGLKNDALKDTNEAIKLSDFITATSDSFATELLSDTQRISKIGLSESLIQKKDLFLGILSGTDEELYNPETDNEIAQTYSKNYFSIGKRKCKEDLQGITGLEKNPQVPLFGFVGRLNEEKGIEILIDALPQISHLNMQFVILGKGIFEQELIKITERYKNVKVLTGFDYNLSKKIYAGSDFFISTSKCETGGTSILNAMKYGSVPVAHCKGAVTEIVLDMENGIIFTEYDEINFLEAINKAIKYYKNKEKWPRLVKQTMSFYLNPLDIAKKYENCYEKANKRMKIFCN